MALRLVYEKRLGVDSKFAPYVSVLPEWDEFTTSLTFKDDELQELQVQTFNLCFRSCLLRCRPPTPDLEPSITRLNVPVILVL